MNDDQPAVPPAQPPAPGRSTSDAASHASGYGAGRPRIEVEGLVAPAGAADPWTVAPAEVLDATGSAAPAPARRRGRTVVALVSAGVAASLVGGAAVAWAAFNGDTGDQPEKHLPATAAAFVKVDLAPSGAQKIDAVRFLAKFPSGKGLRGDAAQDPKRYLYEQLTDGKSAPSWSEVRSWLDDRAALGAVPLGGRPVAVAVLQVSDEAKARATFAAHHTSAMAAEVADGWAVVCDTKAHVDAVVAAATTGTLADDATFRHDTQALGDTGVVAGWADASRLPDLADAARGLGSVPFGGADALKQHGAFVARFTGGDAELALRTFGPPSGPAATGAGASVAALPADTVAALGVSGAGATLKQNWSKLTAQLPDPGSAVRTAERETGLKLPADLEALLGEQVTVAVAGPDGRGRPVVGVHAQAPTAASGGALDRLLQATDSAGLPLQRRDVPGGYVLSTSRDQLAALTTDGGLGRSDAFRDAVPDADGAQFVAYVDVERLTGRYSSFTDAASAGDVTALKAVGVSARQTADGAALTLRVTTR